MSTSNVVLDDALLVRPAAPHDAPPAGFSTLSAPADATLHPVVFTGSGSEYFRIWIVNLLLTLVTVGIYHPWAKVRRLRYFYGNTHLAGHALDFHGEPRKMLRGSLMAGALFLAYSFALEASPTAGLIGALTVSALVPLLMRLALQFRLGHTSWRGLRFGFDGDTAGAYRTLLAPLLLSLTPLALFVWLEGAEEAPSAWAWNVLGVLPYGALLALLPYFFWRLKRYQHDHFRLGQLRSELRLGPWPVYKVFGLTLALLVLPMLVGVALLTGFSFPRDSVGSVAIAVFLFSIALFFLVGLYFYIVVLPFFQARMQNLVWSRTGNRMLRLRSQLSVPRYVLLQLKNYLLVVVTLGLYWPWAAVAARRMRLEALTVVSRVDLDELVMAARPRTGDAAADVGDELFGMDIGL